MLNLNITTIQTSLFWEDSMHNLNHFTNLLEQIENTDLIILPEMFTTGFTMNASLLFENMDGKTVSWMKKMSSIKKSVIIGSLIIKETEQYYNRLIVAIPDDTVLHYDKRHLFRMANEDQYFTPGKEKLIFQYKGWNICPLICYDLRFPVWSRNKKNEIDLYIYVANWPQARVSAWSKLLRARAIENLAYVAGINRIGKDGKGIDYNGGSVVLDFIGEDIRTHPDEKESINTSILSMEKLTDFRTKFAAYLDADPFALL